MATLEWPEQQGLLTEHPEKRFSGKDHLEIPPGKAAVMLRDESLSPVYRAGENPALGKGLFSREGRLFLADLAPTESLPWGCPDIRLGKLRGGCHGNIRFRIASVDRLVRSSRAAEMPLTAERILEEWMPVLQQVLREHCLLLGQAGCPEEELPGRLGPAARETLADRMEAKGLTVEQLIVEGTFLQ